LAKKFKKKIVRREYSKADVRELRAHSKARTPVDKIAKLTKRTVGSLVRRRLNLALASVISADCEADHLTQCAARSGAIGWMQCGSASRPDRHPRESSSEFARR